MLSCLLVSSLPSIIHSFFPLFFFFYSVQQPQNTMTDPSSFPTPSPPGHSRGRGAGHRLCRQHLCLFSNLNPQIFSVTFASLPSCALPSTQRSQAFQDGVVYFLKILNSSNHKGSHAPINPVSWISLRLWVICHFFL